MQAQGFNPGAELIDQLQDIRAAAEPSIWPPAPGWWVVGLIVLVALFFVSGRMLRQLKIRRRRQRVLAELDGLAATFDPVKMPADYLAALNRLFRGVALKAFPGSDCSRLEGKDWVQFIRDRLKGDTQELDALESGPYQPAPKFDVDKLQAHARQWVLNYG